MINNNFYIKLKRSTGLCFTLSDDFKKYYEAGRDEEWRMANGEWRMADGRMADKELLIETVVFLGTGLQAPILTG